MDMYRAVPVSDLCSRYGMCLLVSKSIYSLASPKSAHGNDCERNQLDLIQKYFDKGLFVFVWYPINKTLDTNDLFTHL